MVHRSPKNSPLASLHLPVALQPEPIRKAPKISRLIYQRDLPLKPIAGLIHLHFNASTEIAINMVDIFSPTSHHVVVIWQDLRPPFAAQKQFEDHRSEWHRSHFRSHCGELVKVKLLSSLLKEVEQLRPVAFVPYQETHQMACDSYISNSVSQTTHLKQLRSIIGSINLCLDRYGGPPFAVQEPYEVNRSESDRFYY